jgi:UDP-3-O-[3-hydroxymyristoyl] glucosamine N-acyltransferase
MDVSVQASEIAALLKDPLRGENILVRKARSLATIEPGSVVFAKEYSEHVARTLNKANGALAIVHEDFKGLLSGSYIVSSKPRLAFLRVLSSFFVEVSQRAISGQAVVGNNVAFGENIAIGPGVVIGDSVVIGANTTIQPNVTIGAGVRIGESCVIQSGTVIGADGFGFETDETGVPHQVPHVGSVVIGDNVTIGSLNTIVRGTLDDTIVSDHVKTDDHVHVGHNVRIGPRTLVTACSEISGSVRIGADVWLGPNCSVMNGASIGDRAMIGLAAVVVGDVPPGVVVAGSPAKVLRDRRQDE